MGSAASLLICFKNETIIALDLNVTKGATHYDKVVVGNADNVSDFSLKRI